MTPDQLQHRRTLIRGALAIIGALALYEAVAYSGYFPRVLLPTVQSVATTLVSIGTAHGGHGQIFPVGRNGVL